MTIIDAHLSVMSPAGFSPQEPCRALLGAGGFVPKAPANPRERIGPAGAGGLGLQGPDDAPRTLIRIAPAVAPLSGVLTSSFQTARMSRSGGFKMRTRLNTTKE